VIDARAAAAIVAEAFTATSAVAIAGVVAKSAPVPPRPGVMNAVESVLLYVLSAVTTIEML
jgi:hypothetical protein